jgi:hypothetical protein
MTKVGMRKIFFHGSRKHYNRCVMEDSDGKLFCMWQGNYIRVEQVYGDKNATAGWRTVEAY